MKAEKAELDRIATEVARTQDVLICLRDSCGINFKKHLTQLQSEIDELGKRIKELRALAK